MRRFPALVASFLVLIPGALGEQPTSAPAVPDAQAAYRQFLANVSIQGTTLVIKPGVYRTAGRDLRVEQPASLTVEPADLIAIENEPLKLSRDKPNAWSGGTPFAVSAPRASTRPARWSPGPW